MTYFKRGLDQSFVEVLNNEYQKGSWWKHIADHPSLAIAVRNNYLNVYPSHGGFKNVDYDHFHVWDKFKKHSPKHKDKEYDEVPRGRVIYRESDQTYIVYGSTPLVGDRKFRQIIQSEFNLPDAKTKFLADPHYEDPSTID